MPDLPWDVETRSAASLRTSGAWRYASDPTTEILCLCFAVDDGEVETWLPGQPVPAPFLAAASDPIHWRMIAHNAEFERSILEHVLVPKHGFPPIPLEVQHCSMLLALANSYPAELDLLTKTLGLDYQKDRDGIRLMRMLSQPRKAHKGEDKNVPHWIFDDEKLERLIRYCQQDVRAVRAVWRHPKLKPLTGSERQIQIIDAEINARGVRADRELATAARDLALCERARINAAICELTDGAINTIDQVERIRAAANAHGHQMTTLNKRSVSAVLAGEPCDLVRQMLELRRDGARASSRKYANILGSIGADDRMRGTMRMYGAGPGRWSGQGPQLQNLKKNESGIPLAAIEAVRSGDRERLQAFGNPLTVLGDIARAVICSGPGNVLLAADFASIESRVLAWLAGEVWKVSAYCEYDRSGDKAKEPYRLIAAKMLHKAPQDITAAERQQGKAGELACGFGGSVGAWRRIAGDSERSDAEIEIDVHAWRRSHPKITEYWRALARAIRVAIRTGQPVAAGRIIAEFDGCNLFLVLPSGRRITYPEARLVPSKFEGGFPDVQFKDNARGKWSDYRGWFGTFVENVVQGTARDLLAAAIVRFKARGIPVVLHVHDEVVAEVAAGSVTESDFLAAMLEPPAWSGGLPLAGTVWSGTHYFEPPDEPPGSPAPIAPLESVVETIVTGIAIDVTEQQRDDAGPIEDSSAPLWELTSVPLTADHKTRCPFHEGDNTPSLQLYADHFHCFGCGAHGDRHDWLVHVDSMPREEATAAIAAWDGPSPQPEDPAAKLTRALALWDAGQPIQGTLAERYLTSTRKIDLTALPADIDRVLRFHPRCPFGAGTFHPCLLALMRHATTDAPTGIHRIALTPDAQKIDRYALGSIGIAKLWPAESQLVIGEGLETVLAGALCVPYLDAPLRPAWSLISAGPLGKFPVLPDVDRLIILVDNDGEGRAAAARCDDRWTRAGRTVVHLTPEVPGSDFNDIVMLEASL